MTPDTGHSADHAPRDGSPRLDARMRTALKSVAVCGAVMAAAAFALFGPEAGISVAAGAALAAGNLWALARVVLSLLPEDRDAAAAQSRGAWGLVAALKTAGLLVAAWALLRYRVAAPLPMLVGFGALPMGIAIGSLMSDRRSLPKP
jgi:hypothetical protein